MLWRVRVSLPDHPGALAALAAECGRSGANIVTLQVFPETGSVVDELVVDPPAGGRAELVEIVERTGGVLVSAVPCSPAAAEDQPTRYVAAARAIIERPASFPEVAAELFDATTAVSDAAAETLEVVVGGLATVQIRREVPFSSVERVRAQALADLVGQVMDAHLPPTPSRAPSVAPSYVADVTGVSALVGGVVAGRASVRQPDGEEPWPVEVWVDDAWRRRGIGTRLLAGAARLARSRGALEIELISRADSQAVLPMVLAAGMRGRIRMAGETVIVRISLAGFMAVSVETA